MGRYLLRRLVQMVPTFLGITLLTFAVAHLAPGDPLQLDPEVGQLGADALQQARAREGLDRPLPVQYLTWLGRLARLDFGRSLVDRRPVSTHLAEALPRTLLVSGLALLLAWGLALPLGVWLSTRRGLRRARVVSAGLTLAWGVPTFWVAVALLLFLSSGRYLSLFPFQGLHSEGAAALPVGAWLLDVAWHLVLPVACLTYPALALATRHVRASMETALRLDSVRAARARGIPERRVLRHALRNGLLPVLTQLGLHLPHVVGGSVVVERIFGLPGVGLMAFEAIGTRDYPVVMAVAVVMALATMASMLLVDVAYAWADPRIRLEGGR